MYGQIAKCSEGTPSWSKTRTENGRIEKSNHNDRLRTRHTPGRDTIGKGAACLCNNRFMSTQERSRLFNGCALVKKMLQKLSCINRLLKELEETCKKKYDARRRFPFSILCASVVCRSEMSPSFSFCHVDMRYANCPKRDIIVIYVVQDRV